MCSYVFIGGFYYLAFIYSIYEMELSRKDCNVLKGLAITCVFIHNYCHLLPLSPEENEYSWTIDKTFFFIFNVSDNIFVNSFSFLGHYGVAVFVFLSGFGLVRKYGNLKTIRLKDYIVNHYLKLFKLMFPCFIIYYVTHRLLYGNYDGINFLRFVSQLLFINNLIPTTISPIVPGPYWYFGLTMQLYILFLLLNKYSSVKQCFFAIFCVLALILSRNHYYLTIWLKYNFVGAVVPFVLGGLYAKSKFVEDFNHSNVYFFAASLVSFVLLLISEFCYYSWTITSIFVVVFFICVMKIFNSFFCSIFFSLGRVSHLIFVIHPIVRTVVFYMQDNFDIELWLGIFIYIVLTLFFSLLVSISFGGYKMVRL